LIECGSSDALDKLNEYTRSQPEKVVKKE
jgi:hypothetical protein